MPPRTKRILAPSPITSGVLEHVLLFGLHAQAMPGYLTKQEHISVAGVADVIIPGERKFSMRIWVDPDKLAAYARLQWGRPSVQRWIHRQRPPL